MIKAFLLLAVLFLLQEPAHAFPGMIRHGYVNCTSCHVSPAGGGVLTPYGRGLSEDLLSTWAHKGEGDFLYGAFAPHLPEKLLLGGDTRLMQTYRDNPAYREKRFFLMQSDIEAAYQMNHFTFDFELGYLDTNDVQTLRHFVLYQLDEQNALRLGRFRNNYGINTDEHQLTIKNNLGWTDATETYNFEFSRLTENYSLFATAIFGAPESIEEEDDVSIGRTGVFDQGASLRASAYFLDKHEIGASLFQGKKMGGDWRTVFGPFFILGLSPRVYYMAEVDFQKKKRWGVFDYQRFSYELTQGLHLLISQELAQPDLKSKSGRLSRWGAGLQFFPRPHFEIDLRWHWQKDSYDQENYHPLAWLLLHLYL